MRGGQRSEARGRPDVGSVFLCFGFSVKGRRYTADGMRHAVGGTGRGGFSLVEVTVAIGIFAFVVVGILGLIPTALKLRAESSQETLAVLIAQEMISSVKAAPNIREVTLRDGPGLRPGNNQTLDLTARQSFVLGYPPQSTVPYWLFRGNADAAWENMPTEASVNDIQTMARLRAEPVDGTPNLFQVTVEVRSPATVPLEFTTPVSFSTLVYSPPSP
jgi:type II secretory pathway pseudopilin PulG